MAAKTYVWKRPTSASPACRFRKREGVPRGAKIKSDCGIWACTLHDAAPKEMFGKDLCRLCVTDSTVNEVYTRNDRKKP